MSRDSSNDPPEPGGLDDPTDVVGAIRDFLDAGRSAAAIEVLNRYAQRTGSASPDGWDDGYHKGYMAGLATGGQPDATMELLEVAKCAIAVLAYEWTTKRDGVVIPPNQKPWLDLAAALESLPKTETPCASKPSLAEPLVKEEAENYNCEAGVLVRATSDAPPIVYCSCESPSGTIRCTNCWLPAREVGAAFERLRSGEAPRDETREDIMDRFGVTEEQVADYLRWFEEKRRESAPKPYSVIESSRVISEPGAAIEVTEHTLSQQAREALNLGPKGLSCHVTSSSVSSPEPSASSPSLVSASTHGTSHNAGLAREAVVWADDASPFTGAQVKALLDENERLRKPPQLVRYAVWRHREANTPELVAAFRHRDHAEQWAQKMYASSEREVTRLDDDASPSATPTPSVERVVAEEKRQHEAADVSPVATHSSGIDNAMAALEIVKNAVRRETVEACAKVIVALPVPSTASDALKAIRDLRITRSTAKEEP